MCLPHGLAHVPPLPAGGPLLLLTVGLEDRHACHQFAAVGGGHLFYLCPMPCAFLSAVPAPPITYLTPPATPCSLPAACPFCYFRRTVASPTPPHALWPLVPHTFHSPMPHTPYLSPCLVCRGGGDCCLLWRRALPIPLPMLCSVIAFPTPSSSHPTILHAPYLIRNALPPCLPSPPCPSPMPYPALPLTLFLVSRCFPCPLMGLFLDPCTFPALGSPFPAFLPLALLLRSFL